MLESTADEFVVVFVTVPDPEMGARIARAVVSEKLAACANIVPTIRSIYTWEGKLCDEPEALCLLKTRRAIFPALRDRVLTLHSYQIPEIIAISLAEGNAPYLDWMKAETAGTKTP